MTPLSLSLSRLEENGKVEDETPGNTGVRERGRRERNGDSGERRRAEGEREGESGREGVLGQSPAAMYSIIA